MIELRKLIVKDIKILEVGQTTEYGDSLPFSPERSRDNNLIMIINRRKEPYWRFCFVTEHTILMNVHRYRTLPTVMFFNCLGSHLAIECKSLNKFRKCNKMYHTTFLNN